MNKTVDEIIDIFIGKNSNTSLTELALTAIVQVALNFPHALRKPTSCLDLSYVLWPAFYTICPLVAMTLLDVVVVTKSLSKRLKNQIKFV